MSWVSESEFWRIGMDKKEKYYLIDMCGDGDIYFHTFQTKDLLLNYLKEYEIDISDFEEPSERGYTNLQEVSGKILIKGNVVLPQPKQVVMSVEVE